MSYWLAVALFAIGACAGDTRGASDEGSAALTVDVDGRAVGAIAHEVLGDPVELEKLLPAGVPDREERTSIRALRPGRELGFAPGEDPAVLMIWSTPAGPAVGEFRNREEAALGIEPLRWLRGVTAIEIATERAEAAQLPPLQVTIDGDQRSLRAVDLQGVAEVPWRQRGKKVTGWPLLAALATLRTVHPGDAIELVDAGGNTTPLPSEVAERALLRQSSGRFNVKATDDAGETLRVRDVVEVRVARRDRAR